MTPALRHGLAWLVAVASIALALTTVALAVAYGEASQYGDAASLVAATGLAVTGLLVTRDRRGEVIGWLMLFVSFTQALTSMAGAYAYSALVANHGSLPGGGIASWLNEWLWMPGLGVMATFLLLLFPDGHLPSRRWRWLARLAAGTLTVAVIAVAADAWPHREDFQGYSNPTGVAAVVFPASVVVVGICMVASVASLFVRRRRAPAEERQQLKWILLGTVLLAVGIASSFVPTALIPLPVPVTGALTPILVAMFPVTIGIAIRRYQLFDIDLVITRTFVYGALALFITAVYVSIAVGIGAAIGGGGKPNVGLSILATAIVAVGFQPVRERLQRVANRLVYGKRATPYEVLAQFSERVAESYATDDVMPRMARVLAEGTGAQRADVWLRGATAWRNAAVWPDDKLPFTPLVTVDETLPTNGGASRLVEVRHQGALLGALSVTKRAGEQLTPVEENLLTHLAAQAGLVLKNVGLTGDLQARVDELRASRQRLVSAQDEERRRLERNLHDGAQQHLVALKLKLSLAEMLVIRDPEKATAAIRQLKGDADEALETLRDLARGIYPPLLADRGLPTALEAQARKASIPVTVLADGVERFPQDVEAAVYFCCLEALQNLHKYAQATRAVIRLHAEARQLHFEVRDDGVGFDMATTPKGSGLTNIVDRLDALGGAAEVVSAPGKGTTLCGRVPLEGATRAPGQVGGSRPQDA